MNGPAAYLYSEVLTPDEVEETTSDWKVKTVYHFGKHQDATVTTFHGNTLCVVELIDPVGTYQSVKICGTYAEAHGLAKFHTKLMNAKYN
jgi:hypothetical protein